MIDPVEILTLSCVTMVGKKICCPKYLYNFIRLHVFQNSSSFEPFTASSTSYILVKESRSWSAAQSYCRTYHTDLTSIRSKEEKSNITLTLNGSGVQYVWIGLYRDPWASWSDNTTSTFTNWEPSQPNNYNSAQYCVTMYFMSGKWSDSACNEKADVFCFTGEKHKYAQHAFSFMLKNGRYVSLLTQETQTQTKSATPTGSKTFLLWVTETDVDMIDRKH
uniref:C-type lectin domain-containing protein n=1 Tax=Oreochromis niloticus TaxID=8128 RepID=A0A669DYU5_ORENI